MSHTTVERQAAEFGHVAHVPVHFDDLDAMGLLHNARYAVLLERALTPYWAERGVVFRGDVHAAPDVFHAVREFTITYQAPVTGVGTVAVHFWLEHFGTSSAQYAFEFRSVDGATVHARGTRSIVRLDPATLRPTAWTEVGRAIAATLLRPAPTSA
ncbi:thioesterase family protein [Micromonospora echinospora]|uniref:Acyl-CoA thioester hydrolase n=1 Tax=Micromonospora echinospora TaxID=1877 RepID=A0ABR6M4Q6_MICEC|nr:thioesterase family protein [Micromonospora echinospora]MBB5110356.1 acyl-CoA thioester hydrolase [Micromonospora echinospora]